MDSNIKKTSKPIIPIIIIVVSLLLILLGMFSYLSKDKNVDNDNNKDKDNNKETEVDVDYTKKYNLKDNEMYYDGYIYKIPDGWFRNDDFKDQLNTYYSSTDGEVITKKGAVVTVQKISSNEKKDEMFKDITYFETLLKGSDYVYGLGEGQLKNIEGNPVVVFPYSNDETVKLLIAYMPAYDNYYYLIQLYSSKTVDVDEEMYFDYEDMDAVVKCLNSRVKAK